MQLANYFLVVLCLFALLTLFLNGKLDPAIVASTTGSASSMAAPAALDAFMEGSKNRLAGLSCKKYGGPSDAEAREMVYWRDIPADNQHVSPFFKGGRAQYLSFEPDFGGWNNIRMGMETVVALAFAMGRTLVLPPESRMYLIGADKNGQRNKFSFSHFFHMEAIHDEHPGLDIISMDEFLRREALAGRFRDDKGNILLPPGRNRTNFDGEPEVIYPYLRQVGDVAIWEPDECLAAFPASTSADDMKHILELNETIQKPEGLPSWEDYVGKPIPVDSSSLDRMKEMRANRRRLCIYDQTMQDATLVHFAAIHNQPGGRLLVHFYAFLFFQDWHQDLWMKRFMRDHMRYIDEIQCAAARVVAAVRRRVRERNATDTYGAFDTMHIRRGDFQYKATRVNADEIYKLTKRKFAEGTTVYIATDERDKSFFKVLMDHYDVVFMDDFLSELADVNTNYYGMIDQLIASRGRIFYGCWFSTFTGYINRLRGYHATQDDYPGHQDGIIPSWYYVMEDRFDQMQTFYPVKQSFWAREFPTSWRNLEIGMDGFHETLGRRKTNS